MLRTIAVEENDATGEARFLIASRHGSMEFMVPKDSKFYSLFQEFLNQAYQL